MMTTVMNWGIALSILVLRATFGSLGIQGLQNVRVLTIHNELLRNYHEDEADLGYYG